MATSPQRDYVFILCDQLRADFLRCYGCDAIDTPNLDWLASESVVYENAVSTCPLCVPARAAMLTGMTPLQSGVISNEHWLRPDRVEMGYRTWPELLLEQGYHTAAVGKMHFHPFESSEGFAERIIAEDKRWPLIDDDYMGFLRKNGVGPDKFNAIDLPDYVKQKGAVHFPHDISLTPDRFVAEEAVRLIQRQPTEQPLALMVGFPGPHCPYDPVPELLEHVAPEKLPQLCPRSLCQSDAALEMHARFIKGYKGYWHQLDYTDFTEADKLRIRHHYAALIAQIDDEVGRVLNALRQAGRLDSSVIIFTSDHGDHVGDQERVGKGTFYEPSVHVPLLMRWPQAEGGGQRISTPVALQSAPATILQDACGKLPDWWAYPSLPRGDVAGEVDPVFGYMEDGCMVRTGQWKLCRYATGFCELFDMVADPHEAENLYDSEDHYGERMKLEGLLLDWVTCNANSGQLAERIDSPEPLCRSHAFATRGWKRIYPNPGYSK
ncbi:sulfatase family protein [Cerasicoccus maritimus]|uniref:sulfatase family protein n=1 Tax=Cerasicoccus maritimus TaxID=490089 RepID=UPI0028528E24|nr:sulfatase-like hydrolase/transferase [Cerasicoccus maritimus]